MVSPQTVIALNFTMHGLALACAVLRLYVVRKRGRMNRNQIACQSLMFLACFTEFGSSAMSGTVLHREAKLREEFGSAIAEKRLMSVENLKWSFWSHLLYYTSVATMKLAYLIFYTELYSRRQTKRVFILYVAFVLWGCSYFMSYMLLFLWCLPFNQNWNPATTNPHCPAMFHTQVFSTLAWVNITSDLCTILVPLFVISELRFGRAEKVSLGIIFSIGGISIIASIVRFAVVEKRLSNKVFTWDTVHLYYLWSHAEVFFGVIAFTLPVFRYVLLDTVGRLSRFFGWSHVEVRVPRHGPPTIGSAGKRRIPKSGKSTLDSSRFATEPGNDDTESQVELTESARHYG